jgi:predicted nucleotidyltransferase
MPDNRPIRATASANDTELLAYVVSAACRMLDASKVILFGSRARGDHHPRSDYDIAIVAPARSRESWSEFRELVLEDAPTLHKIDLLLLDDSVSAELRDSVTKDGVVLYGS